LWGDGTPLREFLYVDDLADACLFLMESFVPDEKSMFLNVGCGDEISIRDVAQRVAKIVGYEGEILWDTSKPNGTPRKVLDVGALSRLGWRPEISLNEGLRRTYDWYCEQSPQ
jgi:GDP-L-fucose synthase